MSDLAATNCGGCTQTTTSGGCNCMWIILILLFCGITMMAADAAAAMASLTMETAVAVMP